MQRFFFKTECAPSVFRLTPSETISFYLVLCMKKRWVCRPIFFMKKKGAAKIRCSHCNVINMKLCLLQMVLFISITPHDWNSNAGVKTLLISHIYLCSGKPFIRLQIHFCDILAHLRPSEIKTQWDCWFTNTIQLTDCCWGFYWDLLSNGKGISSPHCLLCCNKVKLAQNRNTPQRGAAYKCAYSAEVLPCWFVYILHLWGHRNIEGINLAKQNWA